MQLCARVRCLGEKLAYKQDCMPYINAGTCVLFLADKGAINTGAMADTGQKPPHARSIMVAPAAAITTRSRRTRLAWA